MLPTSQVIQRKISHKYHYLIEDKPLEVILREIRASKADAEIFILKNQGRLPQKLRLLDFGCGFNCRFLMRIKDEFKETYGVDPKANDLRIPGLMIIKMRFKKELPFETSFFDVITLLAVIEHINEIDQLLQELHRVLNDDGILIMTIPTNHSKKLHHVLARLNLLNREEIYDHKRYSSPEEMQLMVERHGFKALKIAPFQFGFNCLYVFIKVAHVEAQHAAPYTTDA